MTHPIIETVARAIDNAWVKWRNEQPDPNAVSLADMPTEIIAQAAITAIFDAIAEPTIWMIDAGAGLRGVDVWSAMLRTKRLEILGEGK